MVNAAAGRSAVRLLAAGLALGAPALSGCGAPALLGFAAVHGATDSADTTSGSSALGWGRYLPKSADFPSSWEVSSAQMLQTGPAGPPSITDGLTLTYGAPPPQCALPKNLYGVKEHPYVSGMRSADAGGGDLMKVLSAEAHTVIVGVGPVPEQNRLLDELRGLASRCASFQFVRKADYDSGFTVGAAITAADPKLGFGDAAGLTFKFAPGFSSTAGSGQPGEGYDLGFAETVYAAQVKGASVVAVSFSFKDSSTDSALALKLFQETSKRVNSR